METKVEWGRYSRYVIDDTIPNDHSVGSKKKESPKMKEVSAKVGPEKQAGNVVITYKFELSLYAMRAFNNLVNAIAAFFMVLATIAGIAYMMAS